VVIREPTFWGGEEVKRDATRLSHVAAGEPGSQRCGATTDLSYVVAQEPAS
jgi:hypothetical protein